MLHFCTNMLHLPAQAFKDTAFVEEAPCWVPLAALQLAAAAGGRLCGLDFSAGFLNCISQLYFLTVFIGYIFQLCLDVGVYAQNPPNFSGGCFGGGALVRLSWRVGGGGGLWSRLAATGIAATGREAVPSESVPTPGCYNRQAQPKTQF